ncbi:MAG: hypothetical protein RLZZ255_246, partial [Cyanobacteriota bacterium]
QAVELLFDPSGLPDPRLIGIFR